MLSIAHLDLKGVHRRLENYEDYLDSLKQMGYNALLVEYEDRFPFSDREFSSHATEVWPREFVASFQESANSKGIEIIPLQQCLSHLEYAFRRPDYQAYSLEGSQFRDIAVDQPKAKQWLFQQLEQIILAHPRSRYIHLGMDEAMALNAYAKSIGRSPLALFLDYLDELCALCESHGKTPLIWSDMLEDHIAPAEIDRLRSFRKRVILVPWDYFTIKGQGPVAVRFAGFRCFKGWLETPHEAPVHSAPFQENLLSLEDLPEELKELTADLHQSPWGLEPLFQVAVWKKLGFRVMGGAGGTITQDRSLLPYYQRRFSNLDAWREAAEMHELEGIIVTQWARSNSNTVPNLIPDVTWPILANAIDGALYEGRLAEFYKGIPSETLTRLIALIGHCREGWNIEEQLLTEMEALTPETHRYEWKTMSLMLRLFSLQKAADAIIEDVSCYHGIGRLPSSSWQARLEQLLNIEKSISQARPTAKEHLLERYFESAIEEWCCKVFDAPLEILRLTKNRILQSCS